MHVENSRIARKKRYNEKVMSRVCFFALFYLTIAIKRVEDEHCISLIISPFLLELYHPHDSYAVTIFR